MEPIYVGQYRDTNYTFKTGVRKVTCYNCSEIPVTGKTLKLFSLQRPGADKVPNAILWSPTGSGSCTIGYATNEDTAPTITVGAGGLMTIGNHYYYVAYGYGSSETLIGTVSAVGTTSSGQQTITLDLSNNLGATGCTWRKIYKRTESGSYYLRGTISDNTTITFTDTAADNTTTLAPTTSTAYDIKWGSMYGGKVTPIATTGDFWWIQLGAEDNTKNRDTGLQLVVDTNPIWQENDDNIPLSTALTLTATFAVQGSSYSADGRNVNKITLILATSTSTGFFIKIVGKYVAAGTDLTPLIADSTFPMYPIRDTDGGIIYVLDSQMAASTTYKFDVWVVTANTIPEIELYAKVGTSGGSTTLSAILNNTYNAGSSPFSKSSIWSNGVQAIVDRISGSLGTIDLSHRKVHYGKSFITSELITALNGTLKYTIQTANAGIFAHFLATAQMSGEVTMNIHEASSGNTGGTALSLVNKNRVGTPATNGSITSITTGVTVTTNGTLLYTTKSGNNGGSRIGGDGSTREEFILKANTLYTVEIITAASLNGSVVFEWYDGGLDY